MRLLLCFIFCGAAAAQTCASIPLGFSLGANGGRLNGFVPFPASAYWHRDVTKAAVDTNSSAYIEDVRQTADRRILSLYPASQNGGGSTIDGYFYHVVAGNQRRVNVYYDLPGAIPNESDPGPMPIPLSPVVQNSLTANNPFPNYTYAASTDGHVIVVDKDNCVLYELFDVLWDGHAVHAGVGTVFDLLAGDNQRPIMFTSGSVSGLPLFPGFLRDEELSGATAINHPITVTLGVMAGSGNFYPKHSWIAPAEHHQYGTGFNPWWHPSNIPIGSILRLKANFDVSGFPAQGQRILNAMKQYGVIFVDGGNTMDLYSAAGWQWDPNTTGFMYDNFAITSSDFEVITSGNPVYCDPEYATAGYNGGNTPLCPNSTSSISGAAPVISSFTASPANVSAGQAVTLSWIATGASTRLRFITPYVGPVVTSSVITTVNKTTTYTLMVQNQYGRATRTVTVNVGQ